MEHQQHTFGIKKWAEDDRPREKMMKKGAETLSNAELIAILLQKGTGGKTAVDLGREILSLSKDNLNQLGRKTLKELCSIKGIGIAKAITIAAALELGKRRQVDDALQKRIFKSSKNVSEFLIPLMQDYNQEVFCVVYLDISNALISYEFIHTGGVSTTVVDIKLILKNAINHLANRIIVAHNHPSGNLKPSKADIEVTGRLKKAGALVDIEIADHLIISNQGCFSFADTMLL